MELTRKRLIGIIAGAAAIIVLGLYLFLYRPLIARLMTARLNCKTAEAEVLQVRAVVASLKTADIKKGLITEKDISIAIDELTSQGKSKRINFTSITPKKIEKAKDPRYKILPVEMGMESTYKDLGIFLGSLDELEESLVEVRHFKITPHKEDPEKLKTKLVVDIYLSGQNAE